MTTQNVPVEAARQIAQQFGKTQVVILTYDPVSELTTTTTYGVSPFDKENAAAVGKIVTAAIGCDLSKRQDFEDYHRDYDAARYKAALEIMRRIVARHAGVRWANGEIRKSLAELGGFLQEIDGSEVQS